MTATLRERAEHAAKYGANLVVPAREIKDLLDELDALRAGDTGAALLRAVAAVTPCTCSAQRARAEQAEAQVRAARAVADGWARTAPTYSPGVQLIALAAAANVYLALGADAAQPEGELDSARAALAAARTLHTDDGNGYCTHCTRGRVYPVPAPCATAAALAEGGEQR